MRSEDGKLNVFYNRETDEFFAAAPETVPDDLDEEDEDESSLLKEASRLAHSVRVIHLCGIRRTDRPLQVFDDDRMNTDTEAGLSISEAARRTPDSASTARPERSRGRTYRQTIGEGPSKDERTPQQNPPSEDDDAVMPDEPPEDERTPQQNPPTEDNDAVMPVDEPSEDEGTSQQNFSTEDVMPDDPPVDNSEGLQSVVSQREDEQVRTPEGMFFAF